MDVNRHNNNKQAPKDKNINDRAKMLSSFLPKDVLEEIDINDSSKTNSLSKNSSSDKSMDKTTKSQTNNNNGNNNNSDSNNSNNTNSNKSSSNNNKRDNSNSSGNISGNSNNNEKQMNRKIYNSHPKKQSYQINPKLFKNLLPHNYFTNTVVDNSYISESKNANNNRIDINKINNSFNGNNLNINISGINNNINGINSINMNGINNHEINAIGENDNKLNETKIENINKCYKEGNEVDERNGKDISKKWKDSSKKLHKNGRYSNLNLNPYHNLNYSNGFGELNNSMNTFGNNHKNINHNISAKISHGQINNIYKRMNNNMNDKLINGFNNNGINNGFSNIIARKNLNINMINKQINGGLNNSHRINNLNSNINHNVNPNINYINTINNNLVHSMNGNDLNLYNIYQINKQHTLPYNIPNLTLSLDLYQINEFKSNNLGNFRDINIYGNNFINNNISKNTNDIYNKLYKLSNINTNNFKNANLINYNPTYNLNIDFNKNNPKINRNYNHNQNHMNNNISKNITTAKNEITDSEIDYLFSQLYTLPKEVCLLLYIINKKGIPYFISLSKTIKGSKYLQNILMTNPPKEVEIDYITKIICSNYKAIMCDYYGNYFLQKFFRFCNNKHRIDILNSIKKDYINIANDICGNHSLQCLISLQNTNEEKELLKLCIQNNLKELCYGGNSSHVISKIIKILKENERQYINTYIINDLINLCVDSNGICIVKEFIYNVKSNFYIKLLISNFEKETTKLTLNQFGNFVIQEVIKFFGYNYCKNIIKNLINNIVNFSISKFSSNVIDFLIEYLSKKQIFIFCKVLKKIFLKESNFKEMIKNKYSIYVIENCLSLLIKINENYYINSLKNNLGSNFNYSKNSKKSKNDLKNSISDSDSESEEEKETKGISTDERNKEEYSYQNFCKLKVQIFQFIENNSAAKEKKKILALIKENKYKIKK